jgi:hypothetical protein
VPATPAAMTTADSPPYSSGRRTAQNTSAAIKTSAHSGLNARMIAKFLMASGHQKPAPENGKFPGFRSAVIPASVGRSGTAGGSIRHGREERR